MLPNLKSLLLSPSLPRQGVFEKKEGGSLLTEMMGVFNGMFQETAPERISNKVIALQDHPLTDAAKDLADKLINGLGNEPLPKRGDPSERKNQLFIRTRRLFSAAESIRTNGHENRGKQKFLFNGSTVAAAVLEDKAHEVAFYGITPFRLGEGEFKTVKAVFDLFSSEVFALSTAPKKCDSMQKHRTALASLDKEITIQKMFENDEEILKVIHTFSYQKMTAQGAYEKRAAIMEYCEKTLEGFWPDSRPIRREIEEDLKKIIASILFGMIKIHEKGIIHRDLKPDNIMIGLSKDGSPIAKIMDFGLAEFKKAQNCKLVGSPLYMSPEALKTCFREKDEALILSHKEQIKRIVEALSFVEAQRMKDRLNRQKELLENELKVLEECTLLGFNESVLSEKNDVWSLGAIIYWLLYREDFYLDYAKKIGEREPGDFKSLAGLSCMLDQGIISELCSSPVETEFERSLQHILKKALVLKREDRADAKSLHQDFCEVFQEGALISPDS